MTREDVLDMADDPDYAGNPSLIRQLAGQCYDAGYLAGDLAAKEAEWHKITDADSLPEQNKVYWVVGFTGQVKTTWRRTDNANNAYVWCEYYTHWAEIIPPAPPGGNNK